MHFPKVWNFSFAGPNVNRNHFLQTTKSSRSFQRTRSQVQVVVSVHVAVVAVGIDVVADVVIPKFSLSLHWGHVWVHARGSTITTPKAVIVPALWPKHWKGAVTGTALLWLSTSCHHQKFVATVHDKLETFSLILGLKRDQIFFNKGTPEREILPLVFNVVLELKRKVDFCLRGQVH